MSNSNTPSSLRKNPSRETCEEMIRRILMTEVLQKGENRHFKHASDFLSYFEALYPASEGLTKQVQRAVKNMNMPRDERGYFIINKTSEQIKQDSEIRNAFALANVQPMLLTDYTPVFLAAEPSLCSYLKDILLTSITFRDKILTIAETSNGLLLYTNQPQQLEKLCQSLSIE